MNNFFAVSHPTLEVMDVIRRICFVVALSMMLAMPAQAETIR